MWTSMRYSGSFWTSLVVFHLIYSQADSQQSLPLNISSTSEVQSSLSLYAKTITESLTIDRTITESWTTTVQSPAPSDTRTIYSLVRPSPGASPIEITAPSQVLTSYVPELTWCVGPPAALLPVTEPPYLNISSHYATIVSGTESCETVFSPTLTTVCATTLTGLASKITITKCDQEVTFSTECGFTLETPTPITSGSSLITPAPNVKRIFTYWLAPWQSLTAGETPPDVDVKICSELGDDDFECIRHREVWEVLLVTKTLTTTRSVGFTATLSGPGTLIVETLQTFISNTIETIGLSTTLLLETEFETETISMIGRSSAGSSVPSNTEVSTLFITKTLIHRSTREHKYCAHNFNRHAYWHDYHNETTTSFQSLSQSKLRPFSNVIHDDQSFH